MKFYWQNFDQTIKNTIVFLLLLTVAALTFTVFSIFTNLGSCFDIVSISEIIPLEIYIDSFKKGVLELSVPADIYLSMNSFTSTNMVYNPIIIYSFLGFLMIILTIYSASISYLQTWFFYPLATIVPIYLLGFRFEILGFIDASFQEIAILPMLLYFIIIYLLRSIFVELSFSTRIVLFLMFFMILIGASHYLSPMIHPLSFVVNYSMIVSLFLSFLFIMYVSFEIGWAILLLVSTQKTTFGSNGKNHFLFIFILYLLSLFLTYLKNTRIIDIDLIYINPLIWLFLSSIIGIWGNRERSVMQASYFPFTQYSLLIYLSWMGIALSTIAYVYSSANDSLVEVLEDVTLYSHLGFGFGFLLFVINHYKFWIKTDSQVHTLVYRYHKVPFGIVYMIAFLIMIALFVRTNFFPYTQFKAGYSNCIADAYWINGDVLMSKQFYKNSVAQEFQNHKANFMLGQIAEYEQNELDQLKYYKNAQTKNPTVNSCLKLANLQLELGSVFESIFITKEGLKTFKNNDFLTHNLSYYFYKANILDSAYYYSNKISKKFNYKDDVCANQLSFILSKGLEENIDTNLINIKTDNINLIANQIAANVILKKKNKYTFDKIKSNFKDSILTDQKMALLTNFTINNKDSSTNKSDLDQIKLFSKYDKNNPYKENLNFLYAIKQYYGGDQYESVAMLDQLQSGNTQVPDKYLNVLGLLMLKEKANDMAVEIFKSGIDKVKTNTNLRLNLAVASSELGIGKNNYWNDSLIQNNESLKEISTQVLSVINSTYTQIYSEDDNILKYGFMHYNINKLTFDQIWNLTLSVDDKSVLIKMTSELLDLLITKNELQKASEVITFINNLSLDSDQKSIIEVQKYRLSLLQNDNYKVNTQYLTNQWKKVVQLKMLSKQNDTNHIQEILSLFGSTCFIPEAVKATTEYFHLIKRDQQAYEIAHKGINYNRYSIANYKNYVIQSIRYGIPQYATSGLEKLKTLLSQDHFLQFMKTVDQENIDFAKSISNY